MYERDDPRGQGITLETPVRNDYFYGQLIHEETFRRVDRYLLRQNRLFTRLATGYGVVCGLGVDVLADGRRVVMAPGLAVDRWGRQVVVPRATEPVAIPEDVMASAVERAGDCPENACVQVLLCYHECPADPVPVYAGDCDVHDPCAPSTIQERYRLEFRDTAARRPRPGPRIPGLIRGGRIDYGVLAEWVTRGCRKLPADSCIALANLKVVEERGILHCPPDEADIAVRPILASNTVLTALILALLDHDDDHTTY